MTMICIGHLNPVNANDPKGNTIEWKFPDGRQITIFYRKKGVEFGGHFHKGEDPSKNPEKFLCVRGKIWFTFTSLNGEVTEKILQENDVLEILPYVFHRAVALEDCVFVEYRVTHYNHENSDTYPLEDWLLNL